MLDHKTTVKLSELFSKFAPDEMAEVAKLANVYAYATQVVEIMKMRKGANTNSAAKTNVVPLRKSAGRKSMADHYGIPRGTPLNP
jgi:hypothetical protein